MSLKKTVLVGGLGWILAITVLHAWLNLNLFRKTGQSRRMLKVGFLPVT